MEEGELSVGGVRAFYRGVPGEGTPTVYCHGNPTHGEDWLPFLEHGGPAIAVDMPGWGRSDRPDPTRFDYSMYGLSAFLELCFEQLGVERRKLVVHDWGSLALLGAQRRPELIEKLVVIDAVPFFPGYRWHWIAQIWRPSLVIWGEREPYLPRRFAEAYADTLPDAELEIVPGGGHWPWQDDARVVDRILRFLA
jgi:pimeloyl-ACP methyl ester carboxylesterase